MQAERAVSPFSFRMYTTGTYCMYILRQCSPQALRWMGVVLGGAYDHIKAFEPHSVSISRKHCVVEACRVDTTNNVLTVYKHQ